MLRIRCDAKDSQCNLGMKFGANPEEIEPLLVTAKSLGLNFVGVSFHVGSGCREPQIYYEAIQRARDVRNVVFTHIYLLLIKFDFKVVV